MRDVQARKTQHTPAHCLFVRSYENQKLEALHHLEQEEAEVLL